MNFQHTLLKRRGRFGAIWLAAHHPSKINKVEIIQLDLEKKCQEIIEFVINGQPNKPRFSLLVSSHLMYGLCILLKKKNQYIYDDLIYLKQEIHKSYIGGVLVIRKDKHVAKTPKKVKTVEKKTLTLEENLPELDVTNLVSIDSFYMAESKRLATMLEEPVLPYEQIERGQRITIDETLEESSHLIPVAEYDFFVDSFMLPAAELVPQAPITNVEDTLFSIENLEKTVKTPGLTSTTKFSDRIQSKFTREPFRELSTNEQVRRAEMLSTAGKGLEESTVYGELESLLTQTVMKPQVTTLPLEEENIPPYLAESGIQPIVPELYQESIIEAQTHAEIIEPGSAVPVEKEAEILPEEIKAKVKVRKIKAKKRGLIIDVHTEMSNLEMKKRMKKLSEEIETEETEDINQKEELALERLFERNRASLSIKVKHDYLLQDLIKHPSCLMMRKKDRIYSRFDLDKNINCKLIKYFDSMKTVKQKDDEYFYTTESRQIGIQPKFEVAEVRPELPTTTTTTESSVLEVGRKILSEERQPKRKTSILESEIKSGLRKSTFTATELGPQRLQFEESSSTHYQYQEQAQIMPQTEIVPAPGEFETPIINIQPPTPAKEAEHLVETNEYEKLITNSIEEEKSLNKQCFLQDVIKKSKKIDNSKSKKYFAAKMFFTSLKMLKENKINANQIQMYSNIELSFKD